MKYFKLILFIVLSIQAKTSLAWNAAGHQLMSAITWDLLDTEQQKYWVDILKHHPRFSKDFKNNIPKYVKFNPETYNEWIFRQAAVWPDLARKLQNKTKEKFHHGSWHYVNYPLYLDKKTNTSFLNQNTHFKNEFHNDLNIVQAIKGNLSILSKQGVTKKEKALALSWVLHLAGDIHQPLHSTALFSENYFIMGDRGGNLVTIKGQGRVNNLHWYWDSRLNNTTSFKIIDLKANKLIEKYNTNTSKPIITPINQWVSDSHKIASKYVYTPMLLDILKTSELQNKPQPSIYISNEYDKQARLVAEKQIIKAALQLTEVLKEL